MDETETFVKLRTSAIDCLAVILEADFERRIVAWAMVERGTAGSAEWEGRRVKGKGKWKAA